MDVRFGSQNFHKLKRENGQLHVEILLRYEGITDKKVSYYGEKPVRLILDTGAYLTVISRGTAQLCYFDRLPKIATRIFGFSGSIGADYVRIPGIVILGKVLQDVPVLIPHDLYRLDEETGDKRRIPEVLGLNILEYYNYYVDTENDRIYLNENPNPRFYNASLSSGSIIR